MSSGELIVVYFEARFDQWKGFSFPPDLFISVFQNSKVLKLQDFAFI